MAGDGPNQEGKVGMASHWPWFKAGKHSQRDSEMSTNAYGRMECCTFSLSKLSGLLRGLLKNRRQKESIDMMPEQLEG